MNFDFDVVMFLALFTLGAGLVIGLVSWLRAKKAEDHHEDAAVAQRQRHEDADAPLEGTPGSIDPTKPHVAGGTAASPNRKRGDDHVAQTDSDRSWSKERGANPPIPEPPRN